MAHRPGSGASERALARSGSTFRGLALAAVLNLSAPVHAGLTLDQAFRIAESANPALQAARAERAAAEGAVSEASGLLFNNPVAAGDLVRRQVSGSVPTVDQALVGQSWGEWGAGLSQTFEVAGQHGYRRDAARAGFDAALLNIEAVLRTLRADVERAFVLVLALQARIEIEREALRVAEETAEAVRKRVRAGEDSRLEGNLASIEAERARNQLRLLGEQLTSARAVLAALLQLPPSDLPDAIGELAPGAAPYTFEALLDAAARRPQLRTLETRERAARSQLALEQAAVYPDVTLGVGTGREGLNDARERLTLFSVSVPLPLFRRNQAGIGRASTQLAQTQIERQAALRDARAQVIALWQNLESLRARVDRLIESVQPKLEENLRLSSTAFRAGELGLVELLLVNRQVLDGRRDLLDATTELRLTRVAIEEAAGWTDPRAETQ